MDIKSGGASCPLITFEGPGPYCGWRKPWNDTSPTSQQRFARASPRCRLLSTHRVKDHSQIGNAESLKGPSWGTRLAWMGEMLYGKLPTILSRDPNLFRKPS